MTMRRHLDLGDCRPLALSDWRLIGGRFIGLDTSVGLYDDTQVLPNPSGRTSYRVASVNPVRHDFLFDYSSVKWMMSRKTFDARLKASHRLPVPSSPLSGVAVTQAPSAYRACPALLKTLRFFRAS